MVRRVSKTNVIRALITASALLFIVWITIIANVFIHSITDDKQKVDAIVVMGASQWNGRPSPAFKERLDHALNLYNQGLGDYIILTGGIAAGEDIAESSVGKKYIVENGVSEEVVLIEESGRTSLESLQEVAAILEQRNMNSILLVSHGYHIMRIKYIATDLNIKNPHTSPVARPNGQKDLEYMIRESMVLIVYHLSKLNPKNWI
jgi:vancomycin permeability regulator SanA